MAMQMLYQVELGGSPLAQVFDAFKPSEHEADSGGDATASAGSEGARHEAKAFAYARQLVEGTVGNLEAIDAVIRRHAENWRLERMPAIDRNILRLAVYEMLHETKVPKVVIVDEAIELAKKFGAESSSSFVNGLLDGVLRSQPQSRPRSSASDVEAV